MIFTDNIYSQEYFQIIQNAQLRASSKSQAKQQCPDDIIEKHHVIPECFFKNRKRKGPAGWVEGDPNHKDNIAFLTAKEHYRCHWLLVDMIPTNEIYTKTAMHRMTYALVRMSCGNRDKYDISEAMYIETKKLLSKHSTGISKGPRSAEAIQKTNETKIKNGNTGKGRKKSPETIEKYRESRKRNAKPRSSKAIQQAIETARKNGTTRKGIPMSAEAKAKLSASKKGKKIGPHSAETRAKISAGQIGNKRGPKTGEKIRQRLLGRKRSPDSIAKQHETLALKKDQNT